ncbi:MAG: dTDP-4-dehydrorhamnose 3,5-epimerase [Ketobacteraceae bacterium]|nr:dTDP-4-dehydrorhamnose 3,5-epimerase [Ketobacteraceae bacterium]
MQVINTPINDVYLFQPRVFGDERGFFMETFRQSWLEELGIQAGFVQENHSLSGRGILRGLHYQIRQPQGKLVRVIRGEVFDVAVDLRRSSPTFGQWVGEYLSADNHRIMWVPPGFAHGFYVTSDSAEFVYKCTDYYAPEHERTLAWNDPEIAVNWPVKEEPPILSAKDQQGVAFSEAETFA